MNNPLTPLHFLVLRRVKPPNARGELLYNVNLLEPHVALRLVEKVARLSLHTQLDEDAFKGVATAGAKRGFEDELPEDEKTPDDPPPPPPPMGGMHWDGPPQVREERREKREERREEGLEMMG